ncbi:MAG: hypothetical protein JRI23_01860 [Deltaproteobacteria bacterium]|nr:hypothetical protein [Deltaproteobacteria bacterium]MBW2530220.1 hypothetical protein [Deltaproteobacteria bacterium]
MMKRMSMMLLGATILLTSVTAWGGKPPVPVKLTRDGMELIAVEKGVTVYKNEKSDIIWVGAEGRIPAPPEQVQQALLAYERQVGKIGRLSEVKVISRDESQMTVYQRLNLPIISDRDFVLKVRHGKQGLKRWISYWAISNAGPGPRDGIVRVSHHRGGWELLPVAKGKETLLRLEVRIDLAGSVPKWMAKSSAGEELPDLYSSVCRLSVPKKEKSSC